MSHNDYIKVYKDTVSWNDADIAIPNWIMVRTLLNLPNTNDWIIYSAWARMNTLFSGVVDFKHLVFVIATNDDSVSQTDNIIAQSSIGTGSAPMVFNAKSTTGTVPIKTKNVVLSKSWANRLLYLGVADTSYALLNNLRAGSLDIYVAYGAIDY